jgi:broad specificity phosphatase PhoE
VGGADVKAGWPISHHGAKSFEWLFSSPGGETLDAAYQRVQSWMNELDEPVVAISHGLLGRLMRGIRLGLSTPRMLELPAPHDVVWSITDDNVFALEEV